MSKSTTGAEPLAVLYPAVAEAAHRCWSRGRFLAVAGRDVIRG